MLLRTLEAAVASDSPDGFFGTAALRAFGSLADDKPCHCFCSGRPLGTH